MFIKRAAILYEKGGVLEGHSYSNITQLAHKLGISSGCIYGYVDSNDNFIDRNSALAIAKEAHQIAQDFAGPLYPEDLFGEDTDVIQ